MKEVRERHTSTLTANMMRERREREREIEREKEIFVWLNHYLCSYIPSDNIPAVDLRIR